MKRIKERLLNQKLFYLLLLGILLSQVVPAHAQSYRDLGLPPSEIYQKMLEYAQEKDFDRLSKTLQLIKPVTEALDTKYASHLSEDILSAIGRKDGDKALQTIRRFLLTDMKDLLSIGVGAMRESAEKATTKFKTAYLDYLLLSPYIQVKSFSSDQKIKNLFRRAVTRFSSEEELKSISDEIEKELFSADPTLKH
jgi:hypothetical protein